jgi:hypothetical protein
MKRICGRAWRGDAAHLTNRNRLGLLLERGEELVVDTLLDIHLNTCQQHTTREHQDNHRRPPLAPLTRLLAQQSCPELNQMPIAVQAAASSTSAESNTSMGDLPPSSRVTFFRFDSAAAMEMRRPVTTEPVNATCDVSGVL